MGLLLDLDDLTASHEVARAELEALRKDAARWAFVAEHWCSLMGSMPLHLWIDAKKLRLGGIAEAIDYAMNYSARGFMTNL